MLKNDIFLGGGGLEMYLHLRWCWELNLYYKVILQNLLHVYLSEKNFFIFWIGKTNALAVVVER